MVMQQVFAQIPSVGSHILVMITFTFAFSTVLGWTYCGEKAIEYMYGGNSVKAVRNFRLLWVVATFIGAIMPLHLVWNLGTTAAAFMIIPNIIPLFVLSKQIIRDTRYYLWEDRLDEVAKEDISEI